jgi:hypothetical protein
MFYIEMEQYFEIKRCVQKIFKQVEEIGDTMEVRHHLHRLKFTLSGDWKILAIVTGIKAANSNNPCLFCICSSDRLHLKQASKQRSVKNRTLMFGNKYPSLLPKNIPLTNVIPDTLHLHLRITDVLQKIIHKELYIVDNFRQNQNYNAEVHTNTKRYLDFMNIVCKMNYRIYENHKTGTVEGRSLRGDEKTKVFVNIDLKTIMPDSINVDGLQKIIDDYIFIYKQIVESKTTPRKLEKLTSAWMTHFLTIFHAKWVTPYMHLFLNHLHEAYQMHGNIYLYNQQGLEKLNSITTNFFFRGTNMRHEPIKQIFLKRLRGDFLKLQFPEKYEVSRKCVQL